MRDWLLLHRPFLPIYAYFCAFLLGSIALLQFTLSDLEAGAGFVIGFVGFFVVLGFLIRNRYAVLINYFLGTNALSRLDLQVAENVHRNLLIITETNISWDAFKADLLSRLAFVTRMQGNFDDAEQFAKRAVAMHETSWGETHSRTLASRDFIARLYLEIARYKEADALLQVTLQRRESTGTGTTVEAAQCLNDLGRSASERGDPVRAEPMFQHAYRIVQTLKIDDTPTGVGITHNLAQCLAQLERYNEADALIKSLLQRTDRQGSPDSLLVASSLYHLALIKLLRNEPDAAEPIARRALATLQAVAPQDGGRIATFNGLIGRILMKQKRFAEAEPLLKKSMKWREEYLAPEHPLLAESLEYFGELLRSQGGFLESADFYHRAQQIRDFHK